MEFDFQTMLSFGVFAFVAILLHRRFRARAAAAAVVAEDELAAGRRKDVLRALKSMRKG